MIDLSWSKHARESIRLGKYSTSVATTYFKRVRERLAMGLSWSRVIALEKNSTFIAAETEQSVAVWYEVLFWGGPIKERPYWPITDNRSLIL